MTRDEASQYVQDNARYMKDAPSTPYFVRYKSVTFFSDDTHDLVTQLYNYVNTRAMLKADEEREDDAG